MYTKPRISSATMPIREGRNTHIQPVDLYFINFVAALRNQQERKRTTRSITSVTNRTNREKIVDSAVFEQKINSQVLPPPCKLRVSVRLRSFVRKCEISDRTFAPQQPFFFGHQDTGTSMRAVPINMRSSWRG